MRRTAAAPAAVGAAAPARIQLLPLVFVTLGVAVLLSLGVWQVQRLQWKTRLLARIAALKTAPPEPLAVVLNRIHDKGEVNFTHVVLSCPTLEQTPVARIYAVGEEGPGERLVTACPLSGGPFGSVLVDRGFLPEDRAEGFKPHGPRLETPVIGVVREQTPPSLFAPKGAPNGRWFSRDAAGIGRALGAPDPAPVFVMLESPGAGPDGPVPQPVPTDIPNNHLGYAVTWFGLAAALVGVYVSSLLRGRRPKGA